MTKVPGRTEPACATNRGADGSDGQGASRRDWSDAPERGTRDLQLRVWQARTRFGHHPVSLRLNTLDSRPERGSNWVARRMGETSRIEAAEALGLFAVV